MPTYAHAPNGDRVHVTAASTREGWRYSCPWCGAEMAVRGGEHTRYRKHFYHRAGESCHDYPGSAESRDHLEAKSDIEYRFLEADWAADVDVELQEGRVRPDVMCTVGGDRVGVEVQASPITHAELVERTAQRTAEGIYTLWAFHTTNYRSTKRSKNGNTYLTLVQGELGYLAMVDHPASTYIHYYDPEHRAPLSVQRIELFEDGDAGWPEARTGFDRPETYVSPEGYRLAVAPTAVPDDRGDDSQARLF